jgi:hypothetical protein
MARLSDAAGWVVVGEVDDGIVGEASTVMVVGVSATSGEFPDVDSSATAPITMIVAAATAAAIGQPFVGGSSTGTSLVGSWVCTFVLFCHVARSSAAKSSVSLRIAFDSGAGSAALSLRIAVSIVISVLLLPGQHAGRDVRCLVSCQGVERTVSVRGPAAVQQR